MKQYMNKKALCLAFILSIYNVGQAKIELDPVINIKSYNISSKEYYNNNKVYEISDYVDYNHVMETNSTNPIKLEQKVIIDKETKERKEMDGLVDLLFKGTAYLLGLVLIGYEINKKR